MRRRNVLTSAVAPLASLGAQGLLADGQDIPRLPLTP